MLQDRNEGYSSSIDYEYLRELRGYYTEEEYEPKWEIKKNLKRHIGKLELRKFNIKSDRYRITYHF